MRTVTAYRQDGRLVVAIPARFSRAEEREWVAKMVKRLEDTERKRRPSDAVLATRATELAARYLGDGPLPVSVRWSTNQGKRWGSCTPTEGTIRLSTRLQGMPRWVVDYVLLHELVHLRHAGHGPEFWGALDGYPHTARAKGFLEGVAHTEANRGADGADGVAAGDEADAPDDALAEVD